MHWELHLMYCLQELRDKFSAEMQVLKDKTKLLFYMKTNLPNGEARGVFKNIALDMRRFQNLELFVHAEDLIGKGSNLDKSAKFFIRFGSDATDNYYEYEASLKYTAPNATSPLDIRAN